MENIKIVIGQKVAESPKNSFLNDRNWYGSRLKFFNCPDYWCFRKTFLEDF